MSPAFDAARQPFNARIDRRPAAIARCLTTQDVVACVRFALDHDLRISCRSGGHGAEGNCVVDQELLIDLSAMQSVELDLDSTTVRVWGGTAWGQVDLATYPRGLAAPGGGCPQVGVGGLTLGGGLGPLTRTLGLTADNLVQAVVVTSKHEEAVTVDAHNDADLFWALRGGGGGNFGVVTSFVFKLHPIEHAFTAGTVVFNWGDDTRRVLQFFRDWMQGDADRRLTLLAGFGFDPEGHPFSILNMFFNGGADEGRRVITELFKEHSLPAPAAAPLEQSLGPITLPAFTASESTTAFPGLGQYWRSGFLKNDFPDEAIDTLMREFARAPLPTVRRFYAFNHRSPVSQLTFGFIETLGGAVATRDPRETAFYWRHNLFSFTFIGVFATGDPDGDREARAWADRFKAEMKPFLTDGVYVNYLQDGLPLSAYYGGNLDRLLALKRVYDPSNTFAFPQGLSTGV
jgi:FAD/FMN-containing dehydrogenase